MQTKKTILICLFAFLFSSCSKDNEQGSIPVIRFENNSFQITQEVTTVLVLEALLQQGDGITHSWRIDSKEISTEAKLVYTFPSAGLYVVNYVATNAAGKANYSFEVNVMRPTATTSNRYVTTLFEYLPAPGQHINKSPGNKESAEGLLGKKGMVSLGAWGGYVVYGFDHTVLNRPDSTDILIYGNAMESFSEPGIVWVMEDQNRNGLPDDTWYELAGSEWNKTGYQRNYSVTYYKPATLTEDIRWKDSRDSTGYVKRNIYHTQNFYPEWIPGDSYTLKGSRLDGKVDQTIPTLIKSFAYDWGYADNTPGADRFDIANAVDEKGAKVVLKGIDFIKIQTAVLADMGWLGELSTDVLGIADESLN